MVKTNPAKTTAKDELNAAAQSGQEQKSDLDTEVFIRSLRGKYKDVPLTEMLKEIKRDAKNG